MFPSSNNGNDPIFYSDQRQPFHNGPLFGDNITLNSKQAEPTPPSFFHLPSPFIPYELELELELEEREAIFQQSHDPLLHQQQPLRGINSIVSETIANMVDSSKNEVSDLTKICNNISQINSSHITRKRSSKRDRHSKINTAQGPRDCRMRLSLKVARDFFDLQDKLGFDKPSKTVEWLLIQAKHEIYKLSSGYSCSTVIGTKSASSTSECEIVSGIDDAPMKESATKGNPSLSVKKEKKTSASSKTAFHPLARESRDKARARARERTKEKMLTRKNEEPKPCEEATNHESRQLGCWSPFETGEEYGTQSHNLNPSVDVTTEVDAPSSNEQQQFGTTEDMIDDTLAIVSKWSPSYYSIFNNNNGISQEHYHSTDLHSIFKTLEAYNNIQSLR